MNYLIFLEKKNPSNLKVDVTKDRCFVEYAKHIPQNKEEQDLEKFRQAVQEEVEQIKKEMQIKSQEELKQEVDNVKKKEEQFKAELEKNKKQSMETKQKNLTMISSEIKTAIKKIEEEWGTFTKLDQVISQVRSLEIEIQKKYK